MDADRSTAAVGAPYANVGYVDNGTVDIYDRPVGGWGNKSEDYLWYYGQTSAIAGYSVSMSANQSQFRLTAS